ncbi:MAG: hypothetical protein IPP74_09720 [Alphaproteobacteria bacterium]|nr:hypothetical protein [Alphaproteobacteria bacterium]
MTKNIQSNVDKFGKSLPKGDSHFTQECKRRKLSRNDFEGDQTKQQWDSYYRQLQSNKPSATLVDLCADLNLARTAQSLGQSSLANALISYIKHPWSILSSAVAYSHFDAVEMTSPDGSSRINVSPEIKKIYSQCIHLRAGIERGDFSLGKAGAPPQIGFQRLLAGNESNNYRSL